MAEEKKVIQEWDPYGEFGYGDDRPKAFSKMLICGLILAMECLPKGGKLEVMPGEGLETIIVAKGENAAVRERTGEALEQTLPREALEPKYVHPFLMGLLGRAYGYSASMHEAEQGVVHIHIKLPAA